jgi:murein DD-endopeptidase MepM/ murein hydrolase activator NlpD
MGTLEGKGIWTYHEDIEIAVSQAPLVGAKYILCKVSDHGQYDDKAASYAINLIGANPDLVPVAWMYNYLDAPKAEAECIQHALAEGFAAMILDVEEATSGKFKRAEQVVERVQAMGVDTSRIYLCADYMLDTKLKTLPLASLAKICQGGFMPMVYGIRMASDRSHAAEKLIEQAYTQFERHQAELGYTSQPMPVLAACWDMQGKARMTQEELQRWCDEAGARNPEFVSLFRAGIMHPDAWTALNSLQAGAPHLMMMTLAEEESYPLVQPMGVGYSVTAYPPNTPEAGWTGQFVDVESHLVRVRKTASNQTMYATYQPQLTKTGNYLVEVFIPNQNATSRAANYFVVYYDGGQRKESRQIVNQYLYNNTWVYLGTYPLEPTSPESGRVNLIDYTTDTTPKDLAFTAIRWKPVEGGDGTKPGYDAPIGTDAERASSQVWPGYWIDATGFAVPYGTKKDIHTGADLNLNYPSYDSDRGSPIYAIANGVVAHVLVVPESWGGLIIIRHNPLPDGTPVYSRYAHVDSTSLKVKAGDTVVRGQQIAVIGYYAPGKNYHLHFDISCTTMLEGNPRHWPGQDLNGVLKNYVNPKTFIQQHRP